MPAMLITAKVELSRADQRLIYCRARPALLTDGGANLSGRVRERVYFLE